MKNIRDLDIREKKVLIRVDFNVPLDGQRNITDDTRIKGALSTIVYALEQQARVIVCSHLGRPKGKRLEEFSLAPVARHLGDLLSKDVILAPDCIGAEVEKLVAAMPSGDVVLLENLRFHPEETANDPGFSRQLGKLADVYINDAFAVSHRAHASVEGVVSYVDQCGTGFLLQREMDYFHRSMTNPDRPLAAIIGGAKVSSKLGALRSMMDRVDIIIIGGAMANTFLKSQGYRVGTSLVEDDLLDTAKELLTKAEERGVKLYLPVDCVIADRLDKDAATETVEIQDVPGDRMMLDIGPATTRLFGKVLKDAVTIVWNGPMGAFETAAFAAGTMDLLREVASSDALTIIGGGDTVLAVRMAGVAEKISYISTGGGAFLMLMEGKELPGVLALEK